jgi:glycosyltransferase involved in cell wall biosynthesis
VYRRTVKVLVVHNRYVSGLPSGENAAVEAEITNLAGAGVEVVGYLRSSDEIAGMNATDKARVPIGAIHSRRAVQDVTRLIGDEHPDVLHLHNPFPLISLSVIAAAHRAGIPVVQTVHNHRHSCLQGSHLRDQRPCFDCRGKSLPWPAVLHGCYRGSRAQSLPMALALATHRRDQRSVDRYIALSPDVAESLELSGLTRPGQVVIRPNSVPDPGPAAPPGRGLLFVGRLSADKGVPLLLDAWEAAGRPFGVLTIAGDGPERALVEGIASRQGAGVRYLGPLDRSGVDEAMRASAAVVVPSVAPEAHPLVVLEAFSHGRPLLGSHRGGLVTLVTPDVGWLAEPTPAGLAAGLVEAAADDLAVRGQAARALYEREYSPVVVTARQLEIYEAVIAEYELRVG